LQSFADQAVIAIQQVKLFNQAKAGLEQQTAIAGTLKVPSRASFDREQLLRTLVNHATRLCEASHGFVFLRDGLVYRLATAQGASPAFAAHIAGIPVRPERGFLIGRVVAEQRPVQILDALADPDYRRAESQRLGAYRTMAGVPMLSDGVVVGVIVVWHQEVRAFSDRQVELLTTFADQAAIAILNARLFSETKAALERQTAAAEVLQLCGASVADTTPVLSASSKAAAGC
jgi:GAF domain-containing protein